MGSLLGDEYYHCAKNKCCELFWWNFIVATIHLGTYCCLAFSSYDQEVQLFSDPFLVL